MVTGLDEQDLKESVARGHALSETIKRCPKGKLHLCKGIQALGGAPVGEQGWLSASKRHLTPVTGTVP